ncbi:MAG: hypothetical protein ABJA50_01595 [Chloroflexota bacterium]
MNGNGRESDGALFDKEPGLLVIPARGQRSSSVTGAPTPARTRAPEQNVNLHWQDASESVTSLVFSEPRRVGDKTIISAAGVQALYRASDGARVFSQTTPVAIIEVDDHGVRIKPIPNTSLVALTWALTLTWIAYWLLRTLRAQRPY